MRHDWPIRKAIVDLLISMNRPSEMGHTKIGLLSQGGGGGGGGGGVGGVGGGGGLCLLLLFFFLGGKKSTNFIHMGGGWGVAVKWNTVAHNTFLP